ncbi:SRPBCC family protein [Flavobacterium glaciei]|uniref:Polyketide cyclase/dehydrase/lipid transport protein n=1 Tax=Flavobacterium glaciei TaxID=386300 RepID=A0A562PP92_9FLAO|nr:SRPBCC family protein [Flavobacterium glaciei]RDI52520.1 polyketide cyclase/dehydrase/lipid transport protein [Flavobacterium glaciei]TWI46267.1 polyketide cyclase/dehydrase/lipid transport protein [Flavobacterium glaciei]
MRILKYLFLLLLLSFVALSIFVATQKGDFTVERSQIINSPKSTVFNFVNDYRNWEDFSSWVLDDPAMQIRYAIKTTGPGANFSWEGKESSGDIMTLSVKENDSIVQKMNLDGTSSSVLWSFKDTIGGTKVTWKNTGKMSFTMKVYSTFNGGIHKIMEEMYEKSLANLDKNLDFEINTHTVKVNGLVKKLGTFYLRQTFTSEISKVTKNSQIVFPKIIAFCKQNNIELNGKPFIIYHTYDTVNGLTKLSFCIPIKNQILTSSGSDILTGKMEPFDAIKTTLTGDYSHTKKALDKAKTHINTNRITLDPTFSHVENFTISKTEIKNPSKWVTEIYYPIQPKAIPVIPAKVFTTTVPKTAEAIKTPAPIINKEEEESEF